MRDVVDRVTFLCKTATKLWKKGTDVQLRSKRMETDLEGEALGDSKHRGSLHSLKTHVRFTSKPR